MSGPVVITGEGVRYAQLLAWRSALKLESLGMRRSGRSVLSIVRNSALDVIDPESGEVVRTIDPITNKRTAAGAYQDVNKIIVDLLGADFDRPLVK